MALLQQRLGSEAPSALTLRMELRDALAAELGTKAVLCNTRSFSTLSSAARLIIGAQLSAFLGTIAYHGVGLLGWEFDAAKAWPRLKGVKWLETVADDDIILDGARLVDHVRTEAGEIIHLASGNSTLSSHNRPLSANEQRQRLDFVRRALKLS